MGLAAAQAKVLEDEKRASQMKEKKRKADTQELKVKNKKRSIKAKAEKAVKSGDKTAEKSAKTAMICSKHKKSEASTKALEVGLKQQAIVRRTKLAEKKMLATSGEEAVKAMREKRKKAENHKKAEARARKRYFERGAKVGGGDGFEKTEKRMEYDRGLRDGCPGGDCVKGWLKKKGVWNKNDDMVWS